MSAHQDRAAILVAEYAKNRIDMAAINKQIAKLTDWQREDKGVDLSVVRLDYLEEGDRWRGWAYAIEVVESFHDDPITDDQCLLATLLDKKAALRVQAGNIKRAIAALGRQLLKEAP